MRSIKVEDEKHLYEVIADELRTRILKGHYSPDRPFTTERQIIEEFKVSSITASRSLNELERESLIYRKRGSGSFVKLDRISDVKKVGESADNKSISLLLPLKHSNDGVLELLCGCTDYLSSQGYLVNIVNRSDIREKERYLTELQKNSVAGILYHARKEDDAYINKLLSDGIPVVAIDYKPNFPVSHVRCDNVNGGYRAAKYLLDKGHRNIGYFSLSEYGQIASVQERFTGHCSAFREAGLSANYDLCVFDTKNPFGNDILPNINYVPIDERKAVIIKHFIDIGVTAVATENDYTAVAIEEVCHKMGIDIPQKLSIIGFDGNQAAMKVRVPLTTVKQDFYKIGKCASELLLEAVANPSANPREIIVPIEIHENESCSERVN